jgi:hypothetical protein
MTISRARRRDVAGPSERCPHCNNEAGTEPHRELRYRCRICGGPRVALNAPAALLGPRTEEALRVAQRSRRERVAWRAASVALLGFAAFAITITLFVLWATSAGALATTLSALLLAAPALGGLWCALKARRRTQSIASALGEAWRSGARDVLEGVDREFTSSELARVLGLPTTETETLLAALNIDDQVFARVTDDGDVAYRARLPARVRVEAELPDALREDGLAPRTKDRMER